MEPKGVSKNPCKEFEHKQPNGRINICVIQAQAPKLSRSEDLCCLFLFFLIAVWFCLSFFSLVFGTQPGGRQCPPPLPRSLSCLFFSVFRLRLFCVIVTISRFPGFQNLSARLENLSGELDRF